MKTFLTKHPFSDWLATNFNVDCNDFSSTYGYLKQVAPGIFLSGSSSSACSGYYFHNGSMYYGICNGVDPGECVGNFSGFFNRDNLWHAVNDIFGMGRLYICRNQDFWAVTNRYEMGLRWLASFGCVTINPAHFIRGFHESIPIFSQRHSRYGDVDDIMLAPLDMAVCIKSNELILYEKREFVTIISNNDRSLYKKFLSDGIEEIRCNLIALLENNNYSKLLVDLSGGFDSRLVLAAASTIPNYKDKIVISTSDSGNLDLEIASSIVDSIGLNYNDRHASDQKLLRVADGFFTNTSFCLGEYYVIGFPMWSSFGENNANLARLSGACGELYRAIYPKNIDVSRINNEADASMALGGEYENLGTYTDTLSDEFLCIPGNIIDKCELHYLFYRNRLHYGMIQWDWYHDVPRYSPAVSINLFRASRCLSVYERSNEKLMIDATGQLFPILASFPYAAKSGFDRKLYDPVDHRLAGVIFNCTGSRNKWEQSCKKLESESNRRKNMDFTQEYYTEWKSIDDFVVSETKKNIQIITELFPNLSFISDYFEEFRTIHNNQWRFMVYMYGKIASLANQIKICGLMR